MAASLDRGTYLGGQIFLCIRFEQDQINSGNGCLCLDIFVRISRDQNDRGRHLPVTQAACEGYPTHVGHLEIKNEAVELLADRGVQHRCAAPERLDIETFRFKKEAERTEDVEVVIDHANPGFCKRRGHREGP